MKKLFLLMAVILVTACQQTVELTVSISDEDIVSALKKGSATDSGLTVAGMAGVSIPEFFFALVAIFGSILLTMIIVVCCYCFREKKLDKDAKIYF